MSISKQRCVLLAISPSDEALKKPCEQYVAIVIIWEGLRLLTIWGVCCWISGTCLFRYLYENRITWIQSGAFTGLTAMQEL